MLLVMQEFPRLADVDQRADTQRRWRITSERTQVLRLTGEGAALPALAGEKPCRHSYLKSRACHPQLEPGRVYRTRDLAAWSANAPRLAKRLVRDGALLPLAHGLFAYPKRSRFGVVPPSDEELIRAFLAGAPFVFTGPDRWNALGLGTAAVFATPLVYNTKRSGTFELGGRRFVLRRVAFPETPPPEWFVVDLLEHADQAGASRADLMAALGRALARGAFDRGQLREMARRYSTRATQTLVESALEPGKA